MARYITHFHDVDKTKLSIVGGKGANLGELSRIKEINVPGGFCITTKAFERIVGETPGIRKLMDRLSRLKVAQQDVIKEVAADIRRILEVAVIPEDVHHEIIHHLSMFGETEAYAIRSSATAEDLLTSSFAGQYDTFLNIMGQDEILKHIRKCWASLFTDRAISYRVHNRLDHRQVALAVVVQKMVFPQVSGVMFTADPVSSNRKVLSIDATFGLGEALVSGIVNADNYRVRDGRLIGRKISVKKLAVAGVTHGGTTTKALDPDLQVRPTLTDQQVLHLEKVGRIVEAHFGVPQDIEWCLADGVLYIVQSRPITTLFPIPESNDNENRVYLSVGHQQMMTDPMKPLGLSVWRLVAAGVPMFKAGGRLFVDVTQMLASAAGREALLVNMGQFDPLIKDALTTVIDKGFVSVLSNEDSRPFAANRSRVGETMNTVAPDPAVVSNLIAASEKSIETLKNDIQNRSGTELIDYIRNDIAQLRQRITDPKSMELIMGAINASSWINEKMSEWLQEKNAADVLSQSLVNNITSEMGLALLDVADVIRPFPQVIAYLQQVKDDTFLDGLVNLEGGESARAAIEAFLSKYGMRCAGEIDITNPRWAEKPTALVPVILNHVRNTASGESKKKFELGRLAALEKERELLNRLRQLPDGEQKAQQAKQRIDMIRNFGGYREYPKYSIVSRLFLYKKALLAEAGRLVQKGVLENEGDIAYLTIDELYEVLKTGQIDYQLIIQRKDEYRSFELLTPPRVITSEGEVIRGAYKKENLPPDAIAGLAVSSGIIEGRARVILNMEEGDIEEGDILVTTFTDPSWTPLFLSVKGLVTEVGGLMTHGAVIAREYGLPAVVGVENATTLIKDGQRIRVNGTEGYIEIL